MNLTNLLHRIKRHYPITEQTVQLNSRPIQMTIVADADGLLETLSTETPDGTLHLPYWTYLWPAAIGMADYLYQLPPLAGQQILEIGCGFGLAGIVGCQRGGRVLFTDYAWDALMFARYNALRNGCADRSAFVQMDWNTPCLTRQFSLILGSDVIYEEQNWRPILSLLQRYLSADGQAIFSEPNRVNAAGFLNLLPSYGFTVHKRAHDASMDGQASTVSIYCVKRGGIVR